MEITSIKSRLSIQEVLNTYNLNPDKNHRLCCPWHDDKTPSLQIYPDTNSWTCFSSKCNAGSGDQIDFIMKYEKISKHEALVKASELCGHTSNLPENTQSIPSNTEIVKTEKEILGEIAILTKYYQGSLHAIQRSSKARAYAEGRGLNHELLQIGYRGYEIGRTWNTELKAGAEQLGLTKIKNCLVFPMKNKSGQIVSIYGRSISDTKSSKHYYLTGGYQGLYPHYPKPETRQLILTESIIDAATIKDHTDYEVLALYGTNGFTDEHERAIKSLELLQEIILFFDGDDAGKAAVEKIAAQLQELVQSKINGSAPWRLSQVTTPEGEDVNSLLQGHDAAILSHLIDCRDFLFSTEKENKEIKSTKTGNLNTDNAELLIYETDSLHLTILGGIKITGLDRLRVTLKITKREYSNALPVRHSLDLYHSKQVEQLVQKVSESLEISSTETERTISDLTGALEYYRQEKLELLKPKKVEQKVMTEDERSEGIKYLKDKKLLRNTLRDIAGSGIVGEVNNSLIAYLAYTSRKREKPLHIMCLGASGTGKTYLQEKVSELIPEEDKIEITSLSDNAFYYFGREELKHKLILIEDLDGAENVLYPLRELQSKRRITKTVTLKDNKGNLKTITLRVEGPVCVSSCTTRERIYEDNANRCILLYIDDSQAQDQRIMNYQQKSSAGTVNQTKEDRVRHRLQNVQRLLRPTKVINPYAELIDLPQEVFKPRRTLLLLLSFIETITFYHQYQRSRIVTDNQEPFIQSTAEDVEAGFSLLKEVLFSKSDELSKATRTFLERLKKEVKSGEVFTAKELRKRFRIPPSTFKRYLYELVHNGYLKIKAGNKYRGYEYEVIDYEEYERLQNSIDEKLVEILQKIRSSK